MTRIFTEGFEGGDALFWTSGLKNVSTDYKRSGNYSGNIYSALDTKYFSPLSEFYFRFGYLTSEVIAPVKKRCSWGYDNGYMGGIGLDSLGRIAAFVDTAIYYTVTTPVATGTRFLSNYTWYLIEAYVKINATVGRIIIKVDGITEIDFTGNTKPSTNTTVNNLMFTGQDNMLSKVDDLALNDTNGQEDSGWCGDGHIIAIRPNVDSTPLTMTPSSGSTHWMLVDETPPNSTDFVSGSAAGFIDTFELESFSPVGQDITRVWVEARALDTIAEGGHLSLSLIPSGGTNYWSGSMIQVTSLTQSKGTAHTLNPLTGLPWTKTDIDALKIAIRTDGI